MRPDREKERREAETTDSWWQEESELIKEQRDVEEILYLSHREAGLDVFLMHTAAHRSGGLSSLSWIHGGKSLPGTTTRA